MAMFLGNKHSSQNPHFFKIIEEETLQTNKVKIPKKIVRKCGNTLREQVLLKPPCGLEWKIGLSKSSDGNMWIDKGWSEFSKHYSIANGHFLVFRYQGNSQFSVLVFDKTSIEIDYPTQLVKEEPKCDENLDPFSISCPKTRDISPSHCSRPQKRMRKSPVIHKSSTQSHQSNDLRPEGKSSTLSQLSAKEKAQALKRASGFKSKHPFFVLPMQPSYVITKFNLNVPLGFAKKHIGTSKKVILKGPDGRTWGVKFQFRVYYGKSRATIESGWRDFSLGNDLKRGDVCVFALTNTTDHEPILFEVSILCHNEITSSSSSLQVDKPGRLSKSRPSHNSLDKKPLLVNAKERSLEIGNRFQSENPFFTAVMHASYANCKGHFRIPAVFGRTYINNNNESNIRLSVSDGTKSWSVQCKSRLCKSGLSVFELCHGWSTFARDNDLKQGDICTFELTNKDDTSFKVHIAKVSHEECHNLPLAVGPKIMVKKKSSYCLIAGKMKMTESEENTAVGNSRNTKASETSNKFC